MFIGRRYIVTHELAQHLRCRLILRAARVYELLAQRPLNPNS